MTRYRLLGVALFFVCIYSIPAELSPLNYLKVGMKISTAKQLLVEDNWVAVQLNIRINPETENSLRQSKTFQRFVKDYAYCPNGTPYCVFFFKKNNQCVRLDTEKYKLVDIQLLELDIKKNCQQQPSPSIYFMGHD